MAFFRPRATFGLLGDFLKTTTTAVVGLILGDAGGPPVQTGELTRHGADLKWHDGTAPRTLVSTDATQTLINKTLSGTTRVGFADQAADPTAAGDLQRNGVAIKWHDGARVHSLINDAPPTVRGLRGAPNATTPASQYDFDAWFVLLRDVDTTRPNSVFRPVSGSLTCNIAVQGPNGRDQAAAFPNNSWIHFYYIWNGTTLATLASLTAPPGTPTMPTGYTHLAYLTTLRYGTALANAVVRGSRVRYRGPIRVLTGGAATTTTAIDISATVPAQSVEFDVQMIFTVTSTGGAAESAAILAPTTPIASGGVNEAHIHAWVATASSTNRNRGYGVVTTVLSAGVPQLYYNTFPGGAFGSQGLDVDIQGYRVPNGDV
jgi:hypothetical protein